MIWAAKPEAESAMQKVAETFAVRKVEGGSFRFCGEEVSQTDDYAVTVTCKDSAEQIEPIRFEKGRRRMTERATESEMKPWMGSATVSWRSQLRGKSRTDHRKQSYDPGPREDK